MRGDTGIILAGGFGRRMSSVTFRLHKSLLQLPDGKTIVGRMLQQMFDAGVSKVIVVHFVPTLPELHEEVNRVSTELGLKVIWVGQNPQLEYGTMFALKRACLAASSVRDVVVVEGDVICTDGVIDLICRGCDSEFLIEDVDSTDPEAMKCKTSSGFVTYLSKSLTRGPEFCAIIRLSQKDRTKFIKACDSVRVKEPYFEDALNEMISAGTKVPYKTISSGDWIEVDTPEDYLKAQKLITLWSGREHA